MRPVGTSRVAKLWGEHSDAKRATIPNPIVVCRFMGYPRARSFVLLPWFVCRRNIDLNVDSFHSQGGETLGRAFSSLLSKYPEPDLFADCSGNCKSVQTEIMGRSNWFQSSTWATRTGNELRWMAVGGLLLWVQ
jgi:hypothetical protein